MKTYDTIKQDLKERMKQGKGVENGTWESTKAHSTTPASPFKPRRHAPANLAAAYAYTIRSEISALLVYLLGLCWHLIDNACNCRNMKIKFVNY